MDEDTAAELAQKRKMDWISLTVHLGLWCYLTEAKDYYNLTSEEDPIHNIGACSSQRLTIHALQDCRAIL